MSSAVSELPGLRTAKRAAQRILESGDSVRALMFFGAHGCGNQELAEDMARHWLSKTEAPFDGELSRHVDCLLIEPAGASSIITLDAIRLSEGSGEKRYDTPIIDFLRTRPLMGAKKVVFIQHCDRMNSRAANALLKTLEELPEYARIILLTSNPGQVLPTIRSRVLSIGCEAEVNNEGASDPEIVFGETYGRRKEIVAAMEAYSSLLHLFESLPVSKQFTALKKSEQMLLISSQIAEQRAIKERAARADVLECLGNFLIKRWPEKLGLAEEIAEAHRYILGHANASLVFDALLTRLLA
ncbi:MAG: hypothetical protein KDC26_07550 [Armatimonadetes bacterium]|nr:hypothetical protein [Armatimonadota bacterium]